LLGFSLGAQRFSLSGLCEKHDAAAQEGHPGPSHSFVLRAGENCINFSSQQIEKLMQFVSEREAARAFARAALSLALPVRLLHLWDT